MSTTDSIFSMVYFHFPKIHILLDFVLNKCVKDPKDPIFEDFYLPHGENVPSELNYRINKLLESVIHEIRYTLDLSQVSESVSFGDQLFDSFEARIRKELSSEQLDDPKFKSLLYGLFWWRYNFGFYII